MINNKRNNIAERHLPALVVGSHTPRAMHVSALNPTQKIAKNETRKKQKTRHILFVVYPRAYALAVDNCASHSLRPKVQSTFYRTRFFVSCT